MSIQQTQIEIPDFMPFDVARRDRRWEIIQTEGLYGVVKESVALEWERQGLQGQVEEHHKQLKKGGVSTFEVTGRFHNWLDALRFLPEEDRAIGTHANILTVYQAIVHGRTMVNVAAHGLNPLPYGERSLRKVMTSDLNTLIEEFRTYVRTNIDEIAKRVGYTDAEKRYIEEEPLRMDAFDFGKAHNAIVIGAGKTPGEQYKLIGRGAEFGIKAFPWSDKTPSQWGSQFAALSDMYRIAFLVCATGGVGLDNIEDTIATPYVTSAGASSLFGDTPAKTYDNARKMREGVERGKARKAK